jgi:hypothetical protein
VSGQAAHRVASGSMKGHAFFGQRISLPDGLSTGNCALETCAREDRRARRPRCFMLLSIVKTVETPEGWFVERVTLELSMHRNETDSNEWPKKMIYIRERKNGCEGLDKSSQ